MLLNRQIGSWFFLAALLTDVPLDYDTAHETDHCGTCRACLDACPTAAFPAPYVLDARRCISYLTIELRGPVPQPLRAGLGDWLFGCDICQQVCPWNGRATESLEPAFVPSEAHNPVDLAELFGWTDDDFRRLYRGSPLLRAKRRGLLRSAAIVLGNGGDPASLVPLARGLSDAEPLVRGAAAWALDDWEPRQPAKRLPLVCRWNRTPTFAARSKGHLILRQRRMRDLCRSKPGRTLRRGCRRVGYFTAEGAEDAEKSRIAR